MAEEKRRIIATDMDIPEKIAMKVPAATDGGYELVRLPSVEEQRKRDVEVLLVYASGLINRRLFDELPNLRLIQSMSAGVDFIDFDSIPERVLVCSNAGAYKEPIAEHVFAMILFFAKNLIRNHDRLRDGTLESSTDGVFLGGKTIGVIGAGGIGQSVARVAKAFQMRTLGINTSGRPAPYFDSVWGMERLEDLLRESDFVVVALPLTVQTRGLIDKKRLDVMKEDATLVNVARGAIIVESDLYAHLKENPRFKAALDVWWRYPGKGERFSLDHPFFELGNFLATPHNADGVPEAISHGQEYALANVLRFTSGLTPERIVDKNSYRGLKKSKAHPG
jgi:phosphoglycerate dehydrogenase-like enzyme